MKEIGPVFFSICLIGSLSYTSIFGGWQERTGAIIVVLASVLSVIAAKTLTPTWHAVLPAVIIVDMLVVAAFINLALLGNRFWPIWAASFQLPLIPIDLAPLFLPGLSPKAISNAEIFWVYPTLITLVVGTRSYQRNKANAAAKS